MLARKPLQEKTVAKNVLRWGCGALNVDASRVETTGPDREKHLAEWNRQQSTATGVANYVGQKNIALNAYAKEGRWPANVLFDEEAAALLDEQSGVLKSGNLLPGHKRGFGTGNVYTAGGVIQKAYGGDSGGASRFFYVAKASKRERNAGLEHVAPTRSQGARPNSADPSGKFPDHDHRERGGNNHPTVKPIKLMEYLIRMITPLGGTCLDPFLGSGTTLCAAANLGFDGIGIEMSEEYLKIAEARIKHWSKTA